jgi:putative ATP-dependent endonuclease of the OLD family
MAIQEIRIKNYKAFKDTALITLESLSVIVGKNDAGKSGILHALDCFFHPPKKGLSKYDFHGLDTELIIEIEVAFNPDKMRVKEIRLDAKNTVNIFSENLLDSKNLLRFRLLIDIKGPKQLELMIFDYDNPEIFGMAALKKEDDLLEYLKRRNLDSTPSGKITNAERRKTLRQFCDNNNIQKRENWISLGDKEKAFRDILPEYVFFKDDENYNVSETSVQNQFKGIVDKAIRLLPISDQLKTEADKVLNEEFNKVAHHLLALTDSIEKVTSETKLDWKKAISEIALNWTDTYGIELPYESRGAGMRRLFMVAYFQYEAASGLSDEDGPQYIFAIEEPEVHLHPGAQRLLIEAFLQLLEGNHAVIFTTHSPVFASIVIPRALLLIQRTGLEAEALQFPKIDIAVIASELGVEASDRLIGKNCIILVEGQSDAEFYGQALIELKNSGIINYEISDFCFLPCGGDDLKHIITIRKMDEIGLKWGVLADSDRCNPTDDIHKPWLKKYINNKPSTCKFVIALNRTCLENYFSHDAVFKVTGFDIIIPSYGYLQYQNGTKILKGHLKNIKNCARNICKEMGSKNIIDNSMPIGETDQNQSEIIKIFREIAISFNKL